MSPRDRRPGSRPPGVPPAAVIGDGAKPGDLVVRAVRAMSALLPGVYLAYARRDGAVEVTLTGAAVAALEERVARVRGEETATEAIADVTDGSPVGWRRVKHDDKEQG